MAIAELIEEDEKKRPETVIEAENKLSHNSYVINF